MDPQGKPQKVQKVCNFLREKYSLFDIFLYKMLHILRPTDTFNHLRENLINTF